MSFLDLFKSKKPEPRPVPTMEQLEWTRELFRRMADLEPLLPAMRARLRIEAIIDQAFERREW